VNPQEIGRQVSRRRKELGISQENLAQHAEISRNYVSLIERGEAQNISLIIVQRLAEALGATAAELTGEVEQPDTVIPAPLRDFGVAEGLNFSTVLKLLSIPRRGREPQTAEEWHDLYVVVRRYLEDDEEGDEQNQTAWANSHPGQLFVDTFGIVTKSEDVLHYANYLREESGLDSEPPIDLMQIFSRFSLRAPARVALPGQFGLLVNARQGWVLTHADDPETRRRFTDAHELMEMLFATLPVTYQGGVRRIGGFSEATKERLCNQGAAELLMPRASFLSRVERMGVSLQTASQLASEYQVSRTAALVHMALIGSGQHAVVLWRWKHKPRELRGQTGAPKRLRVEWTLGHDRKQHIPTDQSLPDDSCIVQSARSGLPTEGRERLSLGRSEGWYRSENWPFQVNGEWQVLSLLHLPGDLD
jgi:transcriptional regulator with XRE-family HTH domain/Zn-dependent peptidase ImmA (M78 family)